MTCTGPTVMWWIPANVATPRSIGVCDGRVGVMTCTGPTASRWGHFRSSFPDVVEQGDGQHRRDVLAGKREQFVGLIQQGVANSEACRIVGVNRRTGTRWRYGRTVINRAGERLHYLAVKTLRTRSRPSLVRYLTLAERIVITDLHRDGSTLNGHRRRARSSGVDDQSRAATQLRPPAEVSAQRGPANRDLSTGAPTRAPRGERPRPCQGGLESFWQRSGVPSRSPTNCGSDSPASPSASSAARASTRPSMTRKRR